MRKNQHILFNKIAYVPVPVNFDDFLLVCHSLNVCKQLSYFLHLLLHLYKPTINRDRDVYHDGRNHIFHTIQHIF